MNISRLHSSEEVTSKFDYLGNGAYLPENIEWPTNPSGEKLVHFLTISARCILPYVQTSVEDPNKVISIFTSYSKEEYYLDSICYHGDKSELTDIFSGYTQVLIYKPHIESRQESDAFFEKKGIYLKNLEEESEKPEQFSKIGGHPAFLQNEELNLNNFEFCLQISPADLDSIFKDIFYLADAMGYLYLSKNPVLPENKSGIFFIQVT